MVKKWYKNLLTWGCILLCAALLAFGFSVGGATDEIPEEENLRIEVMEDCQVYELQCFRDNSSGGVINADGSALQKGEVFTWEVGAGLSTVTVAALDLEGHVMFERTVTHDFDQSPCTLLLTEEGFVSKEVV